MDKLSTNFNRSEFACKCGCGFDTVDIELLHLCELVRALNGGKSVVVSSGCRCPDYNKKVKGSDNSQHMLGRAADLIVDDPQFIYDNLNFIYSEKYGMHAYPEEGFIHVDSRTDGPARW